MTEIALIKKLFCYAAGAIGSAFISLIGGWDDIIAALIVLMTIDFISGIAAAGVFNKSTKTISGRLDSSEMFKGLIRKGLSLSIVIVGFILDSLAGTDFVRNTAIIGLCVGEILSFIENLSLMGVEMPDAIKQGLEIFHRKKG